MELQIGGIDFETDPEGLLRAQNRQIPEGIEWFRRHHQEVLAATQEQPFMAIPLGSRGSRRLFNGHPLGSEGRVPYGNAPFWHGDGDGQTFPLTVLANKGDRNERGEIWVARTNEVVSGLVEVLEGEQDSLRASSQGSHWDRKWTSLTVSHDPSGVLGFLEFLADQGSHVELWGQAAETVNNLKRWVLVWSQHPRTAIVLNNRDYIHRGSYNPAVLDPKSSRHSLGQMMVDVLPIL